VHPLLALPYAALAGVAEALTHLPVDAEHKAWRAIRNRAGGVDRLVLWAREHRDRSRPLLWMHAPSVGEGLQARPVLERIRARHPQVQLLYTFYSPSAERFAQAMLAAGTIDATEYLPFDTAANAARLLDALTPTALVFAKLDVWPQLVRTAASRGVRLGLISATLSEGSGRGGSLARALLGHAYAALDRVGAIDAADATRLTALGVHADRVTALGDTRYDQVAARAATWS
jgi:3-deoxy-D-manno-octulosonic-acid transferase